MFRLDRIARTAHGLAAAWSRNAAQIPAHPLDNASHWVSDRIDDTLIPHMVHEVVDTLAGNTRAMRRVRKSAAKAAHRATRKLKKADSAIRKTRTLWLFGGILVLVIATGAILWRMRRLSTEPNVIDSPTGPPNPGTEPPRQPGARQPRTAETPYEDLDTGSRIEGDGGDEGSGG